MGGSNARQTRTALKVHFHGDTTFVPMPTVTAPVRSKKCLQMPGDRDKEYMQAKSSKDKQSYVAVFGGHDSDGPIGLHVDTDGRWNAQVAITAQQA